MFKWPGVPSPQASAHELADFVELNAWRDGLASVAGRSNISARLRENDYSGGVPEEEEDLELANTSDMAIQSGDDAEQPVVVCEEYHEIQRRAGSCGEGYPFDMSRHGQTLRRAFNPDNAKHTIYQYLLLATRLNMSNNRVHGDLDGRVIFEKLSAEVGRNYLGQRALNFVFGAVNTTNSFADKINDLCQQLGEGGAFVNRNEDPPTEQDGKLDVVAWKPFSDLLAGKLIVFGQCKTGTDYKDTLAQLQPDAYGRKWFRDQPVVTPVRAFFVSEALLRSRWHNFAVDSGLLFDRCRIVDFCDDISPNTLNKVITWTIAAAAATGLPDPNARP